MCGCKRGRARQRRTARKPALYKAGGDGIELLEYIGAEPVLITYGAATGVQYRFARDIREVAYVDARDAVKLIAGDDNGLVQFRIAEGADA